MKFLLRLGHFFIALAALGFAARASAANSVTVTPSATSYSAAGGTLTFNVSLGYTTALSGLQLELTAPSGWGYSATGGTSVPQVVPSAGDRGAFAFIYFTIPATGPANFNFTVTYPAGLSGNQVFTAVKADFTDESTSAVQSISLSNIAITPAPTAPTITTQPVAATVSAGQNATFTVAASGNPAATFKWQKSPDGVAAFSDLSDGGRISGATTATLTITGALTADAGVYRAVAANGVSPDAVSNPATLTVNKASQTISFGTIVAKSFGDSPFALGATASSGLAVSYISTDPNVATVSGNTVTIVGAGSTTITASQAGNADFSAAANVNQTLTVAKAVASVSLSGLTAAFDGQPKPVGVTTTPTGLPVTVTYDGGATVPSAAGSYAVVATVNAPNHVGSASGTLVIGKAAQTITFAPLAQRVFATGDSFTLGATASSGLAVTYASSNGAVATVSGNTVTVVGVGTTTITASQAGNANFNAATDVAQPLDIVLAIQTITFAGTELTGKKFGDADFTLTATSSSGLTVAFASSDTSVASISGTTVTIHKAGTTNITASQAGNSNFGPAVPVVHPLVVAKATAQVALANLTHTFNNSAKNATATTTPTGLTVVITYAGTASPSTAPVNAGNYGVTATIDDNNYAGSAAGTLVIDKAPQTITFAAIPTKTFGDADFDLTATSDAGLPVTLTSGTPAVATVTGNTVKILAGGTTTITATQDGNTNYLPAPPVPRDLVVAKAVATVTLGSLAQTYSGAPRLATATTVPADLPVVFAYSQASTPVPVPMNAGSYDVTATIQDPRYQGSATGTLVVAKADQTIVFGALDSKPLDSGTFALTATATSALPVSYATSAPSTGTVATVSGSVVTLVNTGTITITASQPGDSNFNAATSVNQVLTVLNQSQTVVFDAAQVPAKTFGATPFNISATSNRGLLVNFVSSNTAVAMVGTGALSGNVTTAQVTIVGAGSADITAKQPGDENTAAAPDVVRTLTVAKAAATVALGNLTATYDGTPKAATATTTPADLNNIVISYTGTAAPAVPPVNAGTYPVTATLDNPNYTGTASGNLVVAKAPQTITFPPGSVGSPRLINAAAFPLTAAASSALPVTFASSNPAVASISGNTTAGFTVTIVGLGTTTLTASQAGDGNYLAAPDATQTLVVNPVAPVIVSTPALSQTTVRGSSFVFGPIGLNALSAPVTFSATNLPAGLSVAPSTGVISGAATVEGTFAIVLTATNATGSDSRTVNLVVQPPAPVITSPAAASVLAGATLNYQMVTQPAIGSGVTVSATGMPQGITFNATNGLLSGTAPGFPTSATVTLTASNSTGSASLPLNLVVSPNPDSPVYTGPASASATAGTSFTFTPTFSASTATPATPTTYALTSGSLPTGLGPISASTGAITGTPTQTGTFRIEITATRGALTGVAVVSIVVNPAATAPVVTIAGGNVRSSTVGGNFTSGNLTATPSAGATISVGTLPGGLTFNSGLTPPTITGSPTTIGTYDIAISATNSAGTGPASILRLSVAPNPAAPILTSAPVAAGRVGQAFTYQLTSSPAATSYAATSALPAGLSLNSATGEITGTPTASGTTRVFFTGTNGSGTSLGLEIAFGILPSLNVPVITSNGSASAQVGQAFNYVIIASGSPTSYAVNSLPAGLSLNTSTGIISGVPTTATGANAFQAQLTATNGDGTSAPKAFAITVAPAPATPVITSAATTTGQAGVSFTYNITATESPTSYVATDLPAGLTLNPTTGVISGTPSVSGIFTASLAAANASGLGAASPLRLTLAAAAAAPAITSAAAAVGQVGVAFSYQITATPGPITGYAYTSDSKGSLPGGLVFNSATGLISGTPTVAGSSTIILTATSSGGTSLPQSLAITISPAANVPVITSAGSATGTVGAAFTYNITATENPTSRDAVNLPDGLAVNPFTGVISGTPNTVGNSVATLVAANANGTGPARDLAITVLPSPTAPVVTSGGTANAQAGTAFAYQIVASGSPDSYELVGAPAWMTINNTSGAVAGTPTVPGTISIFLLARNSAGLSAPRLLTITIAAAAGTPLITSSRTASGTVNSPIAAYTVSASPAATSFIAVGLPPGLTLGSSGTPAVWTISGTPTASGRFPVAIAGTNAAGVGASVVVEFNIATSITFGSN